MRLHTGWLIACSLFVATAAAADVDFERDVAPLLIRHCAGCHNASEMAGGLDLTASQPAATGGDSGAPALAPGDLDSSYLVDRIRDGDMPPEGKGEPVPAEGLATLEAWITAGADWPDGRVLSPFEFTTDTRAGRDWWSLAVPRRPPVPSVRHANWCARRSTPLCWRGLKPPVWSPPATRTEPRSFAAPRSTCWGCRRRREEIEAFVADTSHRRLRAAGRSPAGIAPLWRALGPALARRGPLRREQRLRNEHARGRTLGRIAIG